MKMFKLTRGLNSIHENLEPAQTTPADTHGHRLSKNPLGWLGVQELGLPEYRERHLFLARLRIFLFFGFWAVYIFLLRDVLPQTWPVIALMGASVLMTAGAYFLILRNILILTAMITEFLADLIVITAVIYLTGGPYSPYYTLLILYCLATGLFYHHRMALAAGVGCAIWYAIFLILCQTGQLSPLALQFSGQLPPSLSPFNRWLFLAISLVAAGYGLKIAGRFTKKREAALEMRNRELTALHKLSSAIRRAISLKPLITQILTGVLEGLDFVSALLFVFDYEEKCVFMHSPRRHPRIQEIEKVLGNSPDGLEFPWEILSKPLFTELLRQRIIFRKDLMEVSASLHPVVSAEAAKELQEMLGVGRIVAIPLVASNQVMGALVGLSGKTFVDDKLVLRLEAFANQAALFLEAAELIDKLQKTNDKLEKASKVKSEFLALMGHELRTPLTAIIGFSELLLEGIMGSITSEQRECLEEVARNGKELLNIINSLLDLSKAEAGKITLEKAPVDWPSLVNDAARTLSPIAMEKKIEIKISAEENVPPLIADEKKMRQVLINIMSNAIKFTPTGGLINVMLNYYENATKVPLALRKKLNINLESGAVALMIEDTGIGIKPDHFEKIFEPFHQVDSSITRTYGGTGLGLTLAKQFVELHEGAIWAENREAKGARFWIVIPKRI